MSNVTIYTKDYCGFSARAKALLTDKGVDFTEIDVTEDHVCETEMIERSGRRTVPQIFIEDRHVGGFDDLAALDAKGELEPLLRSEPLDAERFLGAFDQDVQSEATKLAA
jgi:glutaredoxin 3